MGRKKTMLLSFVPISAGLALLAMRPEWPLVVFEYALAAFGWSFIMVVERAMAADVVIEDKGRDSARTFSMIIAPAIFVDGLAPLVASGLLVWGLTQDMLISIGAVTSLLALVIAPRVLRETLTEQTMDRARAGSKVPIRSFGLNYWKTILGMAGFYFASGMTLSYFGNLFVDEWYLDLPTFGLTWTAFSFTQALLTYTVSGLADRNLRASLFLAVLGNWFLIGVSGVGGGVALAFAVNMTSAPLMILWMGAENSIIAANVTEEAQGRAMGVYNLLLNSLNIIAAPLGAMLWISTGSLRSVFIITTIASAPLLLVLGFILRGITAHPSSQESEIAVTP
jgi:MFS family permease